MAEVHTLAIILNRRTVNDDSLLLNTLCESGGLNTFRLPGILKSRRRSAFYLAPGSIFSVRYHAQAARAIVPRETELVFSPFVDSQEYFRLNAVSEIVKVRTFLEPGDDAAQFFKLMRAFLETIPDNAIGAERHADRFYWEVLKLMGLAYDAQSDFAIYDLAAGFLSEYEASIKPDSGLRLPAWWITGALKPATERHESALYRERIRRFLSS